MLRSQVVGAQIANYDDYGAGSLPLLSIRITGTGNQLIKWALNA